jgi:hypothetical protein
MSSVTLVHPEATLTVPVIHAIKKCDLFRNNRILAATPYAVQSPVSLSIFQEFVSALEGKAVTITDTNCAAFQQLSDEFGFKELSAQLSKFCQPSKDPLKQQIVNPLTRAQNALLSESFLFLVNGTVIGSDIAEAATLCSAVREQLSVDGCARKFVLTDRRIAAVDIRSLQLLLSGEGITIRGSQGFLCGLLENVNLELLFLGCSKSDNRMNLSELMMERRIDLESVDVSVISVEELDSLLSNESVSVGSEDGLLW